MKDDNNKARLEKALNDLWPHDRWPKPDTLKFIDPMTVALVAPWFVLQVEMKTPITEQQVETAQQKMREAGALANIRIKRDE